MFQISIINFSIFFTAFGTFLGALWSVKKALDLI